MKQAPKAGEIDLDSHRFGFGQDGNYFVVKCNKALKALDRTTKRFKQSKMPIMSAIAKGWYLLRQPISFTKVRIDLDTSRPSVRQLIQVPIKYMNDHRERLHESSVVLIGESLKEAFPKQTLSPLQPDSAR